MTQDIAIIGAGIAGLTLAFELLQAGYKVRVGERLSLQEHAEATSFAAGGMLAPWSELESAELLVHELGQESLVLWPAILKELELPVFYRQAGSLIVAHSRDRALFEQVARRITQKASGDHWQWVYPRDLEPEIESSLDKGLYLPQEAHLDNRALLVALRTYVSQHSRGSLVFGEDWSAEPSGIYRTPRGLETADWVIDARGTGAIDLWPELRAVRGEGILLRAPGVKIARPIRVMHPRYAVYIVPREDQHYYVGATSIESSSRAPVTVRSTLELLSAAYATHKGFGEATVLAMLHGLRPALPHHRPEIVIEGRRLRLNGLYRHGFLLAPALAKQVRFSLEQGGTETASLPWCSSP